VGDPITRKFDDDLKAGRILVVIDAEEEMLASVKSFTYAISGAGNSGYDSFVRRGFALLLCVFLQGGLLGVPPLRCLS
jgi:hypothetical protein